MRCIVLEPQWLAGMAKIEILPNCIKLVCCLASRSLAEGSLATAAINSDQPEVEVASLRSVEFSLFGVQLWRLRKPIFPAPARSGPCN